MFPFKLKAVLQHCSQHLSKGVTFTGPLSPVCVAIFSFTAAQRGADEYLQTRRCLQCKLQMAVKICW